jgi:hypothetical protein
VQPVISRREAPSAAQDWGLGLHDNPPNGVQPFVRVSQFRRNVPRETHQASSTGLVRRRADKRQHVASRRGRGVMRRHGNASGRDDQPDPRSRLRVPTWPRPRDGQSTSRPRHRSVCRRSRSGTPRTVNVPRNPTPVPDTHPLPGRGSADTRQPSLRAPRQRAPETARPRSCRSPATTACVRVAQHRGAERPRAV